MNRLWIRLSIGFFVLALVSNFLADTITSELLFTERYFGDFIVEDMQEIVTELEGYYETNQNWEGVDVFLKESDTRLVFEIFWTMDGILLAVLDENQHILYDTYSLTDEAKEQLEDPLFLVPIGESGYAAIFSTWDIEVNDTQIDYEDMLLNTDLLLRGGIWGVMAAIFSIINSYIFTRPLHKLGHQVRRFDFKNLSLRVNQQGTVEIRELAKSFNEMADALENMERVRRDLIADVAHELRTPLSVLQGNLRAIIDDIYPLNKEEILQVYDQTRLLTRLVNDLHDLSQAEVMQLSLNRSASDVEELIHEAVSAFTPIAESQQITLSTHVAPGIPALYLDRERILQTLHNLIGNAFRHTQDCGMISVSATIENQRLKLVVEDNGQGIPPEHLPFVFDRFYRVNSNGGQRGAGLGLAITRAIVETHGGTIKAHNTAQGGAVFSISLPMFPENAEISA